MGKLILFGNLASPPTRTVVLTLTELGLDFELKNVHLQNGEHKSEEFLKKNPQHTIPVLEDDGQYIWDSHAIAAYLVRKYGKTDSLYPKDFYQRAVVDQRLHFESGVLYGGVIKGFMNSKRSKEENVAAAFESYKFLESFLTDTYLAGDHLTIADLSVLTSVSSMSLHVPIDAAKTPKLVAWFDLLKQLPYYEEINAKGLELLIARLKAISNAAASK